MAICSCGNYENQQTEVTEETPVNDEERLKKQVEEFSEKIVIEGHEVEEGLKLYNTFLMNHPEYFWLSTTFSYNYDETAQKLSIDIVYPYETSRLKTMSSDLNKKAEEIAGIAKTRGGDFERALFTHDYIIDNCKYANDMVYAVDSAEGSEYFDENTAYGCLLNGSALCGGYSRAFQLIMNKLGQECMLVAGESTDDGVLHGWNIVKMNGEYYHVDVTWDDPVVLDGAVNTKDYSFFGLTTEEILETRTILDEYDVPDCTATADNYFVHNGYYQETYDFDSCKEIIQKQYSAGGIARVKFGSADEAAKAENDLIENKKIYEVISITSASYALSHNILTIMN